jgi:hypothetical protein
MIAELQARTWANTERQVVHRTGFQIGGVSVRVASHCATDVILDPLLVPFQFVSELADIDIRIEWAAPLDAAKGRKLFDSGSIWRLYEHEEGFQFDFCAPAFGPRTYKRLLVDVGFRKAILQMNAECFQQREHPPNPLEYPLDELLITHRLTRSRALELHSCGIVANDGSNLFVGHSGAGKSTTSRLWASRQGVDILSDDRIILREHAGRFFMYGTPWHGEATFALPANSPLTRILIIEHGHGNVLTRLSTSQAVAELFARSFVPFHRHEYVESALEFLQAVAETIPVYRYAFEPDQRAVDTILNFHD